MRVLRGIFVGLTAMVAATGGCRDESSMKNSDGGVPGRVECRGNGDCDVSQGVHCVDGYCVGTCELHDHCLNGSCTGAGEDSDGRSVLLCEADGYEHAEGQFGTNCIAGPGDCDDDSGFVCIGVGQGDLEAYCTRVCDGASDCPPGYYCSDDLTAEVPCEDVCDFPGDRNAPGCVPSSEIGEGRTYTCGVLGLLRTECRKREFCNECETDADCRGFAGQICARDESGARICTQACTQQGSTCPWGTAGVCGMWDPDVGVTTCSHAAGSCVGDGGSCQPCVADEDCPWGACTQNTYTREKYCLDLRDQCSCPENTPATCMGGGCPATPGGLEMTCFGGASVMESVLFNRCWGAETDPTVDGSAAGCWPVAP